jgi:thioredoxin:protein disulfide reductase
MSLLCLIRFVVLTALLAAAPSRSHAASAPRPADEVFQLSAGRDDEQAIELKWSIAEGNYIYRDRIGATLDGQPVKFMSPHGEVKDDPDFGKVEVYRRMVSLVLSPLGLPAKGQVLVTYQGCAEDVLCYPPITKAVNLATLIVSDPKESRRDGSSSIAYRSASGQAHRSRMNPAAPKLR